MEEMDNLLCLSNINAIKEYYVNLIHYVCDNQEAISQQQKEKMEQTVATITSLGALVNSIQDKVFLKQLKTSAIVSVEGKFNYGVDNIDDLMDSIKYDINCINNSKIPLWLSNTMYFFNHNWRKQVYKKILITYLKIKDYLKIESDKDVENARLEGAECYEKAEESALECFSHLLKDINEEIKNKPLSIN